MLHMSYFSYLSPNILCRSHCISHENSCCFDDRIVIPSTIDDHIVFFLGTVVAMTMFLYFPQVLTLSRRLSW